MLRLSRWALAFLAICMLTGFGLAPVLFCRYNVRETGFVDLGIERYSLCYFVGQETPPEDISTLQSIAEEIFEDTSFRLEIIDVDRQKDHPALKYLDLTQEDSRPAAVLVSPHETSLTIPIERPDERPGEAFASSVRSALQQLTDSPLRDRLVRQLVSSYAVVLLLESTDAEANKRARQAARSAMEDIEQQMKFMPKPIARGPVLEVLKADALPSEKILLWSLGMAGESLHEPRAAVLYGRARWIGPVLTGEDINERILFNILSIVGADCECGLDPILIRGTILPIRWGREVQAQVAEELGFDPENPMVKLEVSQILRMKASLYPDAWANPNRSALTVDDLDDLPVPFVEDMPSRGELARENPVTRNLLYLGGALAALVLIVGAFILLRAARL